MKAKIHITVPFLVGVSFIDNACKGLAFTKDHFHQRTMLKVSHLRKSRDYNMTTITFVLLLLFSKNLLFNTKLYANKTAYEIVMELGRLGYPNPKNPNFKKFQGFTALKS